MFIQTNFNTVGGKTHLHAVVAHARCVAEAWFVVKPGSLADPSVSASWLQDPQRFPVIISIEDSLARKICRSGGQADIVVYTGDHSFLNTLGRFRIWINSKLSYVR